jgi:hypothetical protein
MSSVGYNLNIPHPPDDPSDDVGQMQANTNAINTLIGIDHVPFNTPGAPTSQGGYHKVVHMVGQNSTPSTVSGLSQIYSRIPPSSIPNNTVTQLFCLNSNGANLQMTGNTTGGANATPGLVWCAGILFQWGFATATGIGVIVTFSPAFPNYCYSVQVTSITGTNPVVVSILALSISRTGFGATVNVPGAVVTWFAIGN